MSFARLSRLYTLQLSCWNWIGRKGDLHNDNVNDTPVFLVVCKKGSDQQEVSYASTIQTSKGVIVSSTGERIVLDETGSPKAGYHSSSRSHHPQLHPDNSTHLQHPYETESDLYPSPVISTDHRTSHSGGGGGSGTGHRTKTRGKKHKKPSQQPPASASVAVVPTPVISSVLLDSALQAGPGVISNYTTVGGLDMHRHPSDYIVDTCAAQATLISDVVVPTYAEISSVVVNTSPVIITNIDDVKIVPPPPLPNDDERGIPYLQDHLTSKVIEPLIVEPPSYFGVPDLTNQPRKWSIASGDKPVDPKLMAGEMIDVVRSATGLSHKKCQLAAQVVLGYIQVNNHEMGILS